MSTDEITTAEGQGGRAPKIVIAVHGIGDQFAYATIQSVAYQFCEYYNVPSAIPLGRFRSRLQKSQGAFILKSPPDPRIPDNIGFAEVYWAGIPREPVREGYILEKATVWAKTIVGRLRSRVESAPAGGGQGGAAGGGSPSPAGVAAEPPNYEMVERVLLETTEGITVLSRLLFLAEKAGLFQFDLAKLLDDYLNDVQVVAEFEPYRTPILDVFRKVAQDVHDNSKDAEIYIVGHSEGSVVAFLALLREMADPKTVAADSWVKNVRGLMTIGSPIDKHLILWPELWDGLEQAAWQPAPDEPKIEWRNYYDFGDPIGFKLDSARTWLHANQWTAFNFEPRHDIGFGRYPFPGQAHVEYWNDLGVFGHFIEDVIKPIPPNPRPKEFPARFDEPKSRPSRQFVSYTLPYTLVATILCAMVYFMVKAVETYLSDPTDKTGIDASELLCVTLGVASLFGGLTVVSRIPRLTPSLRWRVFAIGVFVLSLFGYVAAVWVDQRLTHGNPTIEVLGGGQDAVAGVLGLAVIVAAAAFTIGVVRPNWGVKTLLIPGFAAVLGVVLFDIAYGTANKAHSGPIWPVVIAGAAFLYLWWLACVLFDLTFIWHRYIRHEAARATIEPHIDAAIKSDAKQAPAKRDRGGLITAQ